jgi:chromosome partitioning protein
MLGGQRSRALPKFAFSGSGNGSHAGLGACRHNPEHACNTLKIIAIANQKGGVGKTTTAVNLAACLAAGGVRMLVVDFDPQANATSALGEETSNGRSIYEPLIEGVDVRDKIIQTQYGNLSLIPADLDLAGAEIEIARSEDHLVRARKTLEPLRHSDSFDFAFLDCPPSLGILMTNALAAADELLIPLQCEYFALEGLTKIMQIMEHLQGTVNERLKLNGILMTMFDTRTNLSTQVLEDVRGHLGDYVYQNVIPRTVRLSEAPSFGKPILYYDRHSSGAVAYSSMAGEFLQRQEGKIQFRSKAE